MSAPLRCTVRGCGHALAPSGGALRCPAGHAFDRAREGYWNLLQPQDRRSADPGDRREALDARRRWLARGFADGLVGTLRGVVDRCALVPGGLAVDLGCGEGTIVSRVLSGRGLAVVGVDLSAIAIRMAARLDPSIAWVVANADRAIPVPDGAARLVLSIFGRRPPSEIARVLAPGGNFVAAVPAADDLAELRAAVQGEAVRRDRAAEAIAALAPPLALVSRTAWRSRAVHDREAAADALLMGYRGARTKERERRDALGTLDVTLAAEILVFRREPG